MLPENKELKSLDLFPKLLDLLTASLNISTAILLLTSDLEHPCDALGSHSLIDTISFSFEQTTLLGDMVVMRELSLSLKKVVLVVSATVRLQWTIDSGATVVQDLIVATASLSFIDITVLGDIAPKTNISPSAQTSGFLVTAGLLLMDESGTIASSSGFLVNTGLLRTDDSGKFEPASGFLVTTG